MNIFFDMEFTGLVPNTTPISLGMIAETGESFYAEFTDFNERLVDDWQIENVFANCVINHFKSYYPNHCDIKPFAWTVIGDSEFVTNNLKTWLTSIYCKHCQEDGQMLQFVSDVCHYDMVLLCNLFGGAMKLPKWINPVCYDICQDICCRKEMSVNERSGIIRWYADMDYMRDAFEISREAVCKAVAGKLPEGHKHNALYDAEVIKMIFEGMRGNAEKPSVNDNPVPLRYEFTLLDK